MKRPLLWVLSPEDYAEISGVLDLSFINHSFIFGAPVVRENTQSILIFMKDGFPGWVPIEKQGDWWTVSDLKKAIE